MRREFRLWHLFVLIAAVAVPLALATQFPNSRGFGWALAYWVAVVELGIFAWWWTRRFSSGLGVLLMGLVGTCVLAPIVETPRTPSMRSSCQNNLRNIALALAAYEDQYGSLPPAVTYDASGRPMHSWRVLILPYLEEQALYQQYRFDEPWDSPHNLQIAQAMPRIFQCPLSRQRGNLTTPYLAVTGDDTLWPNGVGFERKAIGATGIVTVDKVLLVEVPYSQTLWTEPRDLPVEELPLLWKQRTRRNASAWHRDAGVNIVRFEGNTEQVTADDAAQLYRDAHVHLPK